LRKLVGLLGELLLTAGAIGLLFVVYQLVWTNVAAESAQRGAGERLEQSWRRPSPTTTPARAGDGIAFLWIPRLGDDYRKPIIEGVGRVELAKGVGHYPGTAGPGEVGNFALAGHRATNGEPFAQLPRLRAGDHAIVETRDTYYVYRVVQPTGRLVLPNATDVLAPVPDRPGAEPTEPRMTLTTCHPRWGSTHRLIVYTVLESARPKTLGKPPALTGKGF
jgi:sortase A